MFCYMLVDWAHCSVLWQIDSGAAAGGGSACVVKLSYSGPDVKTELISVGRSLCQDTTQRWSVGRDLSRLHTNTSWGNRGNVNLDVIHLPPQPGALLGVWRPNSLCPEQKSFIAWFNFGFLQWSFVLRKKNVNCICVVWWLLKHNLNAVNRDNCGSGKG